MMIYDPFKQLCLLRHFESPGNCTGHMNTLPETNIAPKNGWLEYYFPFGMAYFQGLVSFREGNPTYLFILSGFQPRTKKNI